jgi:hypothetical protein
MQKASIIPGEFLEAGKIGRLCLILLKKALNQMVFLIDKPIAGYTLFTAATRRNDCLNRLAL